MKKINLKGISEILSSKELKNVTGGSMPGCTLRCNHVINQPGGGTAHLNRPDWCVWVCP